jgi:hypothetical protein
LVIFTPVIAYDVRTMAEIDSKQERRRLREYYSRLTDGELEQLSADASDLTETARESLAAENLRRNLNSRRYEAPESVAQPEFRWLQTIRQFRDLPEALLAKGCLESAGIEAFLSDDNMVRPGLVYF